MGIQRLPDRPASGPTISTSGEPPDFAHLDDPAFLDERARVRGLLEYEPENTIGRTELQRIFDAMTAEFLRRARIAWTQTI